MKSGVETAIELRSENSTNIESIAQLPESPKEEKLISFFEVAMNLLANILTTIMFYMIGLIETHFIGLTKDIVLYDSIGLGVLYNNMLVLFICIGFADTIALLCPKSIGSGNLKLASIQINQIRFIVNTFFILISIFNICFSSNLLTIFEADNEISKQASMYVKYTIPAIFMEANFEIFSKYAESHVHYKPVIIGFIIAICIHPFLCYLLIINFNLGIKGAAIASNITTTIKLIYIGLYFYKVNPFPSSNKLPNKEVFRINKLWSIFLLSLITMIQYVTDIVGGCFNNIIAAQLPVTSYAKFIILLNIANINDAISYGSMNTASILIGQFVGTNSVENIKRTIKYLCMLSFCVYIPLLTLIIIFKGFFFTFMNSDINISQSSDLNHVMVPFFLYMIFLHIHYLSVGVMRGYNIVKFPFYITVISLIGIMPIFSYFLAVLENMDIFGITYSQVISHILLCLIWFIYFKYKVNIKIICETYQEDKVTESELDEKAMERNDVNIRKIHPSSKEFPII
jgi:putative MATE family efflux protein